MATSLWYPDTRIPEAPVRAIDAGQAAGIVPAAADVVVRRIRRIAATKKLPNASAPAAPTAAATRTAAALSTTTATASNASAARWQPKWIASGRSAVRAEGVGGRLLPPSYLAACIDARKGTIRSNIAEREREQPAADQDEHEQRPNAGERSVVHHGQRDDEARRRAPPTRCGRA